MKKDLENQIGSINEELKNIYLPHEAVLILLGKRTAFKMALELIDSLQQEQPDVDFEKEFAHEYAIYHLPTFILASLIDGTELIDFIYKTAHHFYELGLNARKEDK